MRLANTTDSSYFSAVQAMAELHRRRETIYVTPQNFIEFRNAATRPMVLNGLGLSVAEVEGKAAGFESSFLLLPEMPDIYPAWKALVTAAGVIGKQVHDARLMAVCQVHAVTHLLTFNVGHFARLATYAPGIVVVHPSTV